MEHKAQEDATEPRKLKVWNWMENQQLQGLHVEGRQRKARDKSNGMPTCRGRADLGAIEGMSTVPTRVKTFMPRGTMEACIEASGS